jgi:hypothetical protein
MDRADLCAVAIDTAALWNPSPAKTCFAKSSGSTTLREMIMNGRFFRIRVSIVLLLLAAQVAQPHITRMMFAATTPRPVEAHVLSVPRWVCFDRKIAAATQPKSDRWKAGSEVRRDA